MKKSYPLLLILLSIISTSFAQSKKPLVDALINRFIEESNLPGVSIAVSQNEEILFAKGYGFSDVDKKLPMLPSTQLRTASVAKVITATALGKLLSQGKVDLDAPVKTYVPYIQSQYGHLTLRQLTGHTSGLPHRPSGNSFKKKQFSSIKESTLLMNTPLLFEPDSEYRYSTHAFNIIAAAIEGISGETYEDYLNTSVFKPLGMGQTFPEDIDHLTDKDATLYYIQKGKLRKERPARASYKLAGAGFRSTPTDLVKMMNGYTNGFITSEVKKTMFVTHTLSNGTSTQVGVTWRTSIDAFGYNVIEHAGSWRGARTVIVHYPKDNLNIAIMINADCPVLIEETAHVIAHLFRNTDREVSKVNIEEREVQLLFNSNGEQVKHKAIFNFKNNSGTLKVSELDIFKHAPLFYLGSKNDYAVVTPNGILYTQFVRDNKTHCNIFLYHTRNKERPLGKTPLASFSL